MGFEPTTKGLTVPCATAAPPRNMLYRTDEYKVSEKGRQGDFLAYYVHKEILE